MTAAAIAALLILPGLDPGDGPPPAQPAAAHAGPADDGRDSLLTNIRGLHQERRWKELTDRFADEDFAVWPADSARQAAEALHLRGSAYAALKDGKRAEADLRAALKIAPRNESAWHALAENYARNLANDREALAAYRQVVAITGRGNGWLPISSTLEMARILTDQVRADEALRLLDAYGDSRSMAPIWRIRWLRAYGHALASRGDEPASLAKFREALEVENANR